MCFATLTGFLPSNCSNPMVHESIPIDLTSIFDLEGDGRLTEAIIYLVWYVLDHFSQHEEEMETRRCGPGKTYRKSYTRKLASGQSIRVGGRCIRSTTVYSSRPSVNKTRMRGYSMKRRTLKACPRGYIKRASYVRSRSGKKTLVPEQCIRNVGAPGKGLAGKDASPGIGTLRKGELAKHGYEDVVHKSVSDRHAALAKAVKEFGSLGVWRKLNAVQIYTRRLSPNASKVFKADMDWVRGKYGLKAF